MGVSILHGKEEYTIEDFISTMVRLSKRREVDLSKLLPYTMRQHYIVLQRPLPLMKWKKYPKMYRTGYKKEYVIIDKDIPYPLGSDIPMKRPLDHNYIGVIWAIASEEGIKVGDKVVYKDGQNVEVIKHHG